MTAQFYIYLILSAILTATVIPIIKKYITTKNSLWIGLAMLWYVLIIWLYTIILTVDNMSVIYSILKVLDILIVLGFGVLMFKESLTMRQIIGIVFAIIAVVLLSK
jgi:multidrug transporter EmrE-like cation transporter